MARVDGERGVVAFELVLRRRAELVQQKASVVMRTRVQRVEGERGVDAGEYRRLRRTRPVEPRRLGEPGGRVAQRPDRLLRGASLCPRGVADVDDAQEQKGDQRA